MLNIDPYAYSLWDWWVCYAIYWRNEQIKQQGDWERARMVAFYSAAPHTKKIKKPTDIVEFDWEKKKKEVLSKEQFFKLRKDQYGF